MRAVSFNSLNVDERRRFVAATVNTSPLFVCAFYTRMSSGPSRQASALSIAGALTSSASLIAALAYGFASSSSLGQASLGFLALYGALFSACAFSLVAYAKNRARQPLPFETGTYILSADVVVAKADGTLLIYALADAQVDLHEVNSREHRFSHLVLSYPDTKLLFVEKDPQVAAAQLARINALRESPGTSVFDGLRDSATPESPDAWRLGALGLTFGAALLAVPTWYARNHFSDEALFARLESGGDLQTMRHYAMGSNSRHAPEAQDLWMERQFEAAGDNRGSLVALVASYPEFGEGHWSERVRDRRFELAHDQGRESLVEFTDAYPDHVAGLAALQALELEHTRDLDTIAAFRAFIAAYPSAPESAEFRDTIARRFTSARAAASAAPEATREVVVALVAFLQAHPGAALQVRFSPPRYYETTRIDRGHRDDTFPARYVRLAPNMTAARARRREEWMVAELNRRVEMGYRSDVLVVRYEGHDDAPAEGPTLDVRYQLVPYGLPHEIGNAVYERFHMDYVVTLQVPGRAPYVLGLRTNPLEPSLVESDMEYPPPRFYDNEARRALQQLARAIATEIFGLDYSAVFPRALEEPPKD